MGGMSEGFVTLDQNDRITYLNPAAERILGTSSGACIREVFWKLPPPADRTPFRQLCQRARKQQAPVTQEVFFLPTRQWLDIRMVPTKGNEALLAYLVPRTMQLSTEAYFAENLERFELIAQTTADVIWDWNLIDNRLWRSEGTEAFIPRERRSSTSSEEQWFACILEGDRDRVREAFRSLLGSDQTRGRLAYKARRLDGVTVDCIEHLLVLRDMTGAPIRVIGCIRDATTQKRLEEQLMRAQRLETVGRVAGGIAHDLNNILTPISMALDVLKLDRRNPEERQVVDNLKSSIAHGANLLQQLLVFARGAESKKEPVDLRKISREVCKIARETFPPGIRLIEELPSSLPSLRGNHTQLRQVLFNLLFNARDAMQGEGVIEVRAGVCEEVTTPSSEISFTTPHILLTVIDNGPGIAPEHLERIWDPFFTTKEEGKGTGLGLSTTAAIVSDHGGAISVHSSSAGTTFELRFPFASERKCEPNSLSPDTTSARILLLEDDDTIRAVARKVLEKRGYLVRTVPPLQALEHLAETTQQFDLVIGDPHAPSGEVSSSLDQIRRLRPGIRIIATISPDSTRATTQPGIHGVLVRPFTAPELLREVEAVLTGKNSAAKA